MKKALNIGLLSLILLQAFSKMILICLFALHQPYLAENRCINRYKIETTCSGKCVLVEVAGVEETEKSIPKSLIEIQEPTYCINSCIELPEYLSEVKISRQVLPPYSAPVSAACVRGIFRPPANLLA